MLRNTNKRNFICLIITIICILFIVFLCVFNKQNNDVNNDNKKYNNDNIYTSSIDDIQIEVSTNEDIVDNEINILDDKNTSQVNKEENKQPIVNKKDENKTQVNNNEVVNKKPVVEEDKKEENSSNQTTTSQESNNTSQESSNANQESNNINQESTNTNQESSNTNQESNNTNIEEELTQSHINNNLRNTISSTYGINIKYKNELPNYKPQGKNVIKMEDDDRIYKYLNYINDALKKYPSGFFKEIKNHDMPLTIYMIEDVEGSSFDGLTDRQYYTNIIMSITVNSTYERTIHHEMMHYIDSYLEIITYNKSDLIGDWVKLNPDGFSYGNKNSSYSYHLINNTNNAYFISDYAQTNHLEDRATLFEDMMSRPVKPRGCYELNSPLRLKAELLSKQIEDNFNSVKSSVTENWERFIK